MIQFLVVTHNQKINTEEKMPEIAYIPNYVRTIQSMFLEAPIYRRHHLNAELIIM